MYTSDTCCYISIHWHASAIDTHCKIIKKSILFFLLCPSVWKNAADATFLFNKIMYGFACHLRVYQKDTIWHTLGAWWPMHAFLKNEM